MPKYISEVTKHFSGDKTLAARYMGVARGLLGSLVDMSGDVFQNARKVILPDGTKITVSFVGSIARVYINAVKSSLVEQGKRKLETFLVRTPNRYRSYNFPLPPDESDYMVEVFDNGNVEYKLNDKLEYGCRLWYDEIGRDISTDLIGNPHTSNPDLGHVNNRYSPMHVYNEYTHSYDDVGTPHIYHGGNVLLDSSDGNSVAGAAFYMGHIVYITIYRNTTDTSYAVYSHRTDTNGSMFEVVGGESVLLIYGSYSNTYWDTAVAQGLFAFHPNGGKACIAINREDILEVVFTASEYGGAISATSSITTIDGMVLNEHITGNHPVYDDITDNRILFVDYSNSGSMSIASSHSSIVNNREIHDEICWFWCRIEDGDRVRVCWAKDTRTYTVTTDIRINENIVHSVSHYGFSFFYEDTYTVVSPTCTGNETQPENFPDRPTSGEWSGASGLQVLDGDLRYGILILKKRYGDMYTVHINNIEVTSIGIDNTVSANTVISPSGIGLLFVSDCRSGYTTDYNYYNDKSYRYDSNAITFNSINNPPVTSIDRVPIYNPIISVPYSITVTPKRGYINI